MSFLDCVNRILRIQGFIRGDTDPLTSFSDSSHNSSSAIAQIAVQEEIADLTGRGLLPYQKKEQQTITLATGTRTYSLPSDFTQMWGDPPLFYDSAQNNQIFEYPGDEKRLSMDILTYRTDSGYPMFFYFPDGTTRTVAFYPVPDSSINGKALTYDYLASVNVSASSDTIPLTTTDQQYAFARAASRRFKFLYEGKTDQDINKDAVYLDARSTLFALLKNKKPAGHYGKNYVATTGMDRF